MQCEEVNFIIRIQQSSHFQMVKQLVEQIEDLCVDISPKTLNPKKKKKNTTEQVSLIVNFITYKGHVCVLGWLPHRQGVFTIIHKSFPVSSWNSKVSIVCTLQNLTRNSGSSRYFLSTVYSDILLSHTLFHRLFSRKVCDYGYSH